jgi:hypothetical protein
LSAELWTAASGAPRPHETGRPELLRLLDQLVELAARILRGTRYRKAAHLTSGFDRGAEHGKVGGLERRRQILDFHPTAQVRLVGTVLCNRFRIRQAQERPRRVAADECHQPLHQRLQHPEHQLLGREGDLQVDLRELGLTIGPQVLVAEALHDLEIAIDPGNHQDLLEDLRRLGQRIELARVHPARHEIVAGPFGRRLREHRRLDLEEALLIEILPNRHRRLMTHDHVALHARASQIDVAILEPRFFGDLDLVANHERRRFRLVEQAEPVRADLDLPGGNLRIDGVGGTVIDTTHHRDHELGAQPLCVSDECVVVANDDLGHAVTVAHIDEHQRAKITNPMDPAEQHGVLTDVLRP